MNNNNKIILWSDYQAQLKKLQDFNKAQTDSANFKKADYLQAYNDLLQLREQGFPLLLREGEAYIFDIPPVNAYLLPPLKATQERWLLVFFVTEDEKSWVQLLSWHSDDNSARIERLAQQPRQIIKDCKHRLDLRAIDVHFVQMGNTYIINLVFLKGVLTLVATGAKGIESSSWQDDEKNDPWSERYSFGQMEPAIRISRYDKVKNLRWFDDAIEDIDGNLLLASDAAIGRIRGADGAKENPSLIYLASNRDCVFRLDKTKPGQQPKRSVPLYNEVLDVLALPWLKSYALLAAVRNGAVYLLTDDLDKNTIAIRHWQHIDSPIWRLIGRGDDHILSMDERQTLTPLRLTNPIELAQAQNIATIELVEKYYTKELAVFFNASFTVLNEDANKFLCLGQLALEFFLYKLDTEDKTHRWQDFSGWCVWLNEAYATATAEQQQTLMLLHKRLIKRVIRWLQTSCFHNQPDRFKNYAAIRSELDVILEILTLKQYAPDALWILLFRHFDWLRLWAEQTQLLKQEKFLVVLTDWEQAFNRQRKNFSYGLWRIRPLNARGSYRLLSQATHFDVVNYDVNNVQLVFIQASRDLHVLQFNPQGSDWNPQLFVKQGKHWQGQAQFVRTMVSTPHQPHRFLIGTLLGELVILNWDGQSSAEVDCEEYKQDCDFAVVNSLLLKKHEGYLLLGGRNFEGYACIYGLSASRKLTDLHCLWVDKNKGSICMLRTSKDNRQLWAINRDSGRLYYWQIDSLISRIHSKLGEPKIWLHSVQKLHALQYSFEHKLLVCGGDGGLAVAMNTDDGSLRWLVNCQGNLRHIACLPKYNQGKGVWLLGSDERSSLMVDSDGRVTGALENASPASAVKVIDGHLLLATLDGRLLWMGMATDQPALAAFVPPAAGLAFYPVRGGDQLLNSNDLSNALILYPKNFDESLINMMTLRLMADFLSSHVLDEDLNNAFKKFWQQQNLAKQIVFLYWLRALWLESKNLPDVSIANFTLNLLDDCWHELPNYPDTNLLCKLISPMFDILDRLIELENPKAVTLRNTITQYLWRKLCNKSDCLVSKNQGSPTEQNLHHLKTECFKEQRVQHFCPVMLPANILSAIRLNQVLKYWYKLRLGITDDLHRLFAWCNAVAQQVAIIDTEQLRALLQQLFQANLRLLAIDHPYQIWLINLVTEPEITHPAPELLQRLQQASEQLLLTEDDWETLADLWGDNSVWRAWLENLKIALTAVRSTHLDRPHKAWAERGALMRLREHIVFIGTERFTVLKQQTLLALWWRQLSSSWTDFIDSRLRELEVAVQKKPEDYLTLTTQAHWRDSQQLQLKLIINNRFPTHLNLVGILWQNEKHNTHLPIVLPADDSLIVHTIELPTEKANQLQGQLILQCSDVKSGQPYSVPYKKIEVNRNLSRLSSDPQWDETWNRLEQLLVAYTEQQQCFYWIDGDVWTLEERHLLKQDIKNNYAGLSVDDTLKFQSEKHDRIASNAPMFSPDLALNASPRVQLEQLHALLQSWLGAKNKVCWALALWHLAHGLPASIVVALQAQCPKPEVITQSLQQLLGSESKAEQLIKALTAVPNRAVGAWIGDEPFYALKPEESQLAEALYLPVASLLPTDIWALLDWNNVSITDLAVFLSISSETAELQRKQRQIFQKAVADLFVTGVVKKLIADKAAQLLLGKLGIGSVAFKKPVWVLETTVTLNWHEYTRVYLLPKSTAIEREALHEYPKGLWLCLGETVAPTDLAGIAITLNEQQALALLHTEHSSEALLWLNRIAGTQRNINPTRVFHPAGGLGSLISKQFEYRVAEMNILWSCLKEADSPGGWGSALIIGGRRMGKTCLRERILYEVKRDQPQRVCLSFNFEGQTELSQSKMHGIELEFWFFQKMAEKFTEQGQPFEYSWSSAFKQNENARDEARIRLRQHLTSIKKNTGYAVLFTFDETEHLVKADTQDAKNRYALFGLLRSLLQNASLCLIATSYPFGADYPYALNIANHDATSSVNNTFPHKIKLSPWLPEQAWEYLHSRLSGFGVVLPRYYREEVINISRGVPWIIHFFGSSICETLLAMPLTTKVVTTVIWQEARKKVLREILKELKESVERAAEIQDQINHINFETQAELALSQGRLWSALNNLARKQDFPLLQNERFLPDCLGFYVSELEAKLPAVKKEALRETLILLAKSPTLEGDDTDGNHYIFANNLLPMWLHYSKGDKS